MIKDIEKTIREYLPNVLHMSLATCSRNKPWVCEVHFVYDNDLNLYFRSRISTRHSKEIAENSNVAGNIVEQHELDDNPRGVYFEGTAELMQDVSKTTMCYKEFCERLDMDEEMIEDAKQENGHKFFKVSVETFYLFDSRESRPSQKYELKWGNRFQ